SPDPHGGRGGVRTRTAPHKKEEALPIELPFRVGSIAPTISTVRLTRLSPLWARNLPPAPTSWTVIRENKEDISQASDRKTGYACNLAQLIEHAIPHFPTHYTTRLQEI